MNKPVTVAERREERTRAGVGGQWHDGALHTEQSVALVGREADLAALRDAFAEVRDGRTRTVALGGEAGGARSICRCAATPNPGWGLPIGHGDEPGVDDADEPDGGQDAGWAVGGRQDGILDRLEHRLRVRLTATGPWPTAPASRAIFEAELSGPGRTGTDPAAWSLAQGLSNRQIAERLHISVKTASVHVSNILRKTGAVSRTEAAYLARAAEIGQ